MEDFGIEMWNMELYRFDLECGIWNEGTQTWNVEYDMRDVGIACVIWDFL